jgi:hypothetical protein
MKRALSSADKSINNIASHMASLDRDIDRAIMPRVSEVTLATEIRAFWRAKSNIGDLTKAVASDARTASAVLSAPDYLSGLDDKSREVVRTAAVNAHAAEHQAQLKEAGNALRRLTAAASCMNEVVEPKVVAWRQEPNPALKALEGGRS